MQPFLRGDSFSRQFYLRESFEHFKRVFSVPSLKCSGQECYRVELRDGCQLEGSEKTSGLTRNSRETESNSSRRHWLHQTLVTSGVLQGSRQATSVSRYFEQASWTSVPWQLQPSLAIWPGSWVLGDGAAAGMVAKQPA